MSTTSTEIVSSSSAGPSTMSYDELLDRYGAVNSPPSSNTLKTILESLKAFSEVAKIRSDNCDRGMRELSKRTKELRERIRERELAAEREAEEERKEKLKKARTKKEREDEHRPLAVGAHALARQDGGELNGQAEGQEDSALSTLLQNQDDQSQRSRTSLSPASSIASHQPKPEPAVPQYQTFGPDPFTFDDPTIYEIRDIDPYSTDPQLTEEEKKEILGVTRFPHSDLRDFTVGPLPDKDLVNVKPQNQVTAHQFQTYLETFVRPVNEEDLAFLRERGDRVGPFVIPNRGARPFKDIWAEQDQLEYGDSIQNTTEIPSSNEPSGSIEQMTDDLAETSEISTGPLLSRLLATMRPERRGTAGDVGVNGDTSMLPNGEVEGRQENSEDQSRPLPPATYLPESVQFGPKASGPKLDYKEMDERLKQELRYIGFLSEDAEPDYEGHNDDEVAARLRYLQEELQRIGILNGARKARVLELVEEVTAKQEWSTIAEDLDSQLNQAYLKRHRNIGKGKSKPKRPGAPGGSSHLVAGGLSKPSLGESIRALMQRRVDWTEVVGPVVDFGKEYIPTATIFDDVNMKRLMGRELELWSEAQEQG